MLKLIDQYKINPNESLVALIISLLGEMEAAPYRKKIRAKTGAKVKWDPLFNHLEEAGVDISTWQKACGPARGKLRSEGISEELLPTDDTIKKRHWDWKKRIKNIPKS